MICALTSRSGVSAHIDVAISTNTDPTALGDALLSYGLPVDFARGFPVCRATVTYPAEQVCGYLRLDPGGPLR
jgi:hypothetical protein